MVILDNHLMNSSAPQSIEVPPTGTYTVDASASKISFDTKHLFGLGSVHGIFPIRSGSVEVTDPAAGSRVQVEIDAAGVDSANPGRDKQVRAKGLLDTEAHPTMSFTAGVAENGTLTGTLTVRDVTRPLTLQLQELSVQQDAFTARATVTVDRYEFGVTGKKGLAARMLTLTVEVRCTR
jgi:polyisoprenoid-binding protein YceI